MIVRTIKTQRITAGMLSLTDLLDRSLDHLEEGSIVAITSKIVSLCEGNVVPMEGTDREALIVQESHQYLPATLSKYGHHFTITNNTLIPAAGIDNSNGGDDYVLWPKDSQKTANDVRVYLRCSCGRVNGDACALGTCDSGDGCCQVISPCSKVLGTGF